MRLIKIMLLLTVATACGSQNDVNVNDSKHTGYVSIAETWREVCIDRFNIYDYPNNDTRDMLRAECKRRFADGEEVLIVPDIPTEL